MTQMHLHKQKWKVVYTPPQKAISTKRKYEKIESEAIIIKYRFHHRMKIALIHQMEMDFKIRYLHMKQRLSFKKLVESFIRKRG